MTKLTDDFLRSFSLPQVALLHTLAMEMETYGLTASEVVDICLGKLESIKIQTQPETQTVKPTPPQPRARRKPRLSNVRCPHCHAFCEITPVNVSKCTMIGGPWKSSIMCSNNDCRFTQLSEKTPQDWRDSNGNIDGIL